MELPSLVTALATYHDALNPLLAALRRHPQEEAVPIKVLTGFRDGFEKRADSAFSVAY